MSNVVRSQGVGRLSVTVRDDERLGRVYELMARNEYDKDNETMRAVFDVTGDTLRLNISSETMAKLIQLVEDLDAKHQTVTGEA